jgi:N-acetylmuramoyl-L-alanine amidase
VHPVGRSMRHSVRDITRDILRRHLAILATSSLAGMVLLALPIRSQQNDRRPATISQIQVASNSPSQQNSFPSPNVGQAPASAATDEAQGVTVVLDPAHGGADFGARGPTGLAESDVVLDFARAARIALEAQRLRVLLTREGNQDPSFDNRSAMVNGLRNAVLISLHVSSSGPVGTARTYYYAFPSGVSSTSNATPNGVTPAGQTSPPGNSASQPVARGNLIEWDHAQRSSVDLSRQLATLAQTELVRRFRGSPEMPTAAPVRQLRTVATPAIAIELSSIDVTDAKRLDQMAQPLAEAIGRAVAEFHYPVNTPRAPNPGIPPNVQSNGQSNGPPNGPAAPNTAPAPASGAH